MNNLEVAESSIAPAEAPPARRNRFLARQPILNAQQKVVAYELLFRSGLDNFFSGDPDESTRQILDNILVAGADSLSSNTRAFVNCTRETLIGGLVTLMPPRQTVLEILETVPPDPEVIAACRALKKLGYRIALDDFCGYEGMDPLIDLAHYVKVDFRASDATARKGIRGLLHRSGATLVAEKIEDEAEFKIALAEGYELFQGYFFCRPTLLTRDEVAPAKLGYLRLIAALAASPVDHREIERIVKADAPFCFRVLRLVNSPIFGMRGEIRSVQRALFVLGDEQFRKLATIAVASSAAGTQPHVLLALSLQRARLCELLAPHLHQDPVEQYLLGLLSLIDAILQTPMAAIVAALPLRPPVRLALLGKLNAVAMPLAIAQSYELGNWLDSGASKEILSLGSDLLNKLCLEATAWAKAALESCAE
jgi:EAL and modified HD-GYP domain-containing signal transduction protein